MEPLSFVAAFALSREPIDEPAKTPPPVVTSNTSAPYEIVSTVASSTFDPAKTKFIGPPEQIPCEPKQPDIVEQKSTQEPTFTKINPKQKRTILYRANPPMPITWQLIDRFGIAWTHQNKNYLEQYVAQRNHVQPQSYSYSYAARSSCSSGSCGR